MKSFRRKKARRSKGSDALICVVEAKMRRWPLVPNGERVLVAVSGGLDSMVLLDLLHRVASAQGWKLVVAHYNHQLRGWSSAADERLVRRVASECGLKVISGRGDVRKYARRNGVSIEMAARKLRHEFLASAARRCGAGFIATGHHANDQAELFFIRLLRGSGSGGMGGMKESGASPVDPGIQIVRPLLSLSRAALEEYAAAREIRYREDATNRSRDFFRNRIRLELMPLLRRIQPGWERTVSRSMAIARSEGAFVQEAALDWLASKDVPFEGLHAAVQRRCVHCQLEALGIRPDFELVEELRLNPGKRVSMPGGNDGNLVLARDGLVRVASKPAAGSSAVVLGLGKETGASVYDGVRVKWKRLRGGTLPGRRAEGVEYFDAESIGGVIKLRHWLPGDRFQPTGMAKPVKLQDLLTNAKIPREKRSSLIVGEDADGRIFWVEGLRISERHKVLKGTRARLRWAWERSKAGVAGGYI